MLSELWPLFGLVVETPQLELRLPREDEAAELALVASRGVHRPDERPFLTPWAEGSPEDRAHYVLRSHWSDLASWQPDAWRLGLGVFHEGAAIGEITLRARDFAVVREVTTSSWLGLAHHGRGLGTEARLGALALAFEHLGARSALTEVFPDNHPSQAVSRKLGYVHDGTTRDRRGDEALVSDRLRLADSTWRTRPHPTVTVTGFDPCRRWLGL